MKTISSSVARTRTLNTSHLLNSAPALAWIQVWESTSLEAAGKASGGLEPQKSGKVSLVKPPKRWMLDSQEVGRNAPRGRYGQFFGGEDNGMSV
jgi:hypothetical protein